MRSVNDELCQSALIDPLYIVAAEGFGMTCHTPLGSAECIGPLLDLLPRDGHSLHVGIKNRMDIVGKCINAVKAY